MDAADACSAALATALAATSFSDAGDCGGAVFGGGVFTVGLLPWTLLSGGALFGGLASTDAVGGSTFFGAGADATLADDFGGGADAPLLPGGGGGAPAGGGIFAGPLRAGASSGAVASGGVDEDTAEDSDFATTLEKFAWVNALRGGKGIAVKLVSRRASLFESMLLLGVSLSQAFFHA